MRTMRSTPLLVVALAVLVLGSIAAPSAYATERRGAASRRAAEAWYLERLVSSLEVQDLPAAVGSRLDAAADSLEGRIAARLLRRWASLDPDERQLAKENLTAEVDAACRRDEARGDVAALRRTGGAALERPAFLGARRPCRRRRVGLRTRVGGGARHRAARLRGRGGGAGPGGRGAMGGRLPPRWRSPDGGRAHGSCCCREC